MPHSALQAGQYSKWRSGRWQASRGGSGLAADFSFKTAWDLERLPPNTFFPVPASVVFAGRGGVVAPARPLAGTVERWEGSAGSDDVVRVAAAIADTGVAGYSPYAGYSRQGATIVPQCLFFVHEVENQALVQAGQTVTVDPRRGGQDKAPWKNLDLTAITGQSVESAHLFDVHLGETLVPYGTLEPLQALLPLRQGETAIPVDTSGVGGIRLGGLDRWRRVSAFWVANKAEATELDLLGQLNYMSKLGSQIEWQRDHGKRLVRVVYSKPGEPTAALLRDDATIIDHLLFWITCKNEREAYYLLAIINSRTLATAVNKFTTANWAGNTRDLHKHLWKLPIPEFDASNPLHVDISKAGEAAAAGAAKQLERLRQDRPKLTVTIARRELRKWLRTSTEGKAVEERVGKLLGGGVGGVGKLVI